ncbi:MAG: hypothetical protein ABR597_12665 [Bacteroidales bacterium]
MEKQKQFLKKLLLCSMFFICCAGPLVGQEKLNVSAGIGLPEFLNVGLRFQHNQAQIGLSVGTMPLKDESLFSVSGDVYYHFAGSSALSDRRPWYGRVGLNYLRNETHHFIDKFMYFNVRVGRDFNISEKFGVNFDAGAIFELYNEEIRKVPPSGWNFDFDFPVLPSFGIGFFYRL